MLSWNHCYQNSFIILSASLGFSNAFEKTGLEVCIFIKHFPTFIEPFSKQAEEKRRRKGRKRRKRLRKRSRMRRKKTNRSKRRKRKHKKQKAEGRRTQYVLS